MATYDIPSAPYTAPPPYAPTDDLGKPSSVPIPTPNTKWHRYIKQKEITIPVARQLLSVLTRVKVVMLVDDSSSMTEIIKEPQPNGSTLNLFAQAVAQKRRWDEVMQAAFELVGMVTAASDHGALDIWFFHHEAILNVDSSSDARLSEAFGRTPSGGTPLLGTLNTIYEAYDPVVRQGTPVLLLIVSDGEPSDGSQNDLEWKLQQKHSNMHVSFIEANDNEEEMAYMDGLDSRIPNFHNSDDYRLERQRVLQSQAQRGNPNFRFTYVDYIVMSVLSTFIPAYFLLDQNKAARLNITPLPPMSEKELDAMMDGYTEIKTPEVKVNIRLDKTYTAVPVQGNNTQQPRTSAVAWQTPSANSDAPPSGCSSCVIL